MKHIKTDNGFLRSINDNYYQVLIEGDNINITNSTVVVKKDLDICILYIECNGTNYFVEIKQ